MSTDNLDKDAKKTGGDVGEAPESGEPSTSGRSHGQSTDTPERPQGSTPDESGRPGATPVSSKK